MAEEFRQIISGICFDCQAFSDSICPKNYLKNILDLEFVSCLPPKEYLCRSGVYFLRNRGWTIIILNINTEVGIKWNGYIITRKRIYNEK